MPYDRKDDFDNFGYNNTSRGFSQDSYGSDPYSDGNFGSLGGYVPENSAGNSYGEDPYQGSSLQNESFGSTYERESGSSPVNTLTYDSVKNSGVEIEQEPAAFEEYHVSEEDMMFQKKNKRKTLIIVSVFIFFVCLVIIYSAIANAITADENQKYLDEGITVTARVTDSNINKSDNGFYLNVLLEYEVNGNTYTTQKSFKDKTLSSLGRTVRLVVLPTDPGNPKLESALENANNKTQIYIEFGILIVVLLIPPILLFIHYKKFLKDPYNLKYYKNERAKFYREHNRSAYGSSSSGSIWTMQIGNKNPTSSYSASSTKYKEPFQPTNTARAMELGDESPSGNYSAASKKREDPHKDLKSARILFIVGLVWVILFLIPAGVLGFQQKQEEDFFDNANRVYAEVYHISVAKRTKSSSTKHHTSSSTHYEYYASVRYQIGDTLYKRGEFQVDSDTDPGDRIMVYVNPDDPGDCRVKEVNNDRLGIMAVLFIFAFFGLIFGVLGMIFYVKNKRRLIWN